MGATPATHFRRSHPGRDTGGVTHEQGSPRRAKHLMDPNAPRQRTSPEDLERLQRVQRWVMSVLAATTILHLSVGLVIAAALIDPDEQVARIGLCVIGAAFGVIAVVTAFAIHRRPLVSPWLLLGVLPGIVGLVIVLA